MLYRSGIYRGADKSLSRPGRKQATATEDFDFHIQGGSNMTGTDLYVYKPHCAAAVRP